MSPSLHSLSLPTLRGAGGPAARRGRGAPAVPSGALRLWGETGSAGGRSFTGVTGLSFAVPSFPLYGCAGGRGCRDLHPWGWKSRCHSGQLSV